MSALKSPFWEAVGVFGGMIIGSGMFALPYAVSVSGLWWAAIMFAVAVFAALSLHMAYGEVVSNTFEKHRLPGYTKLYLGIFWGRVSRFTEIILFNATLLAYGILAGIFLQAIFPSSYSPYFWTFAFFLITALILLFESIERIGMINFILTIPLIAATLFISFLAFGKGDTGNLMLWGNDNFFSFGVFMFALAGLSAIPDAFEVFKNSPEKSKLKSVIWLGTAIPAILYVVFALAVLFAVDGRVSEDAISSLKNVLGDKVLFLGATIGFLAVFTSFLVLSYDLKRIYELDLGISKLSSWLSAILIPPIIFMIGAADFIKIISVVGGIFIILDGFFVIFILRNMRKKNASTFRFLRFGALHQAILMLIFTASIVYELVYQIL